MEYVWSKIFGYKPSPKYSSYGGWSKGGPFVKFPHKKFSSMPRRSGPKKRKFARTASSASQVSNSRKPQRSSIDNNDVEYASTSIGPYRKINFTRKFPAISQRRFDEFAIAGSGGLYSYAGFSVINNGWALQLAYEKIAYKQGVSLVSGFDAQTSGGAVIHPNLTSAVAASGYNTGRWQNQVGGIGTIGGGGVLGDELGPFKVNSSTNLTFVSASKRLQYLDVFFVRCISGQQASVSAFENLVETYCQDDQLAPTNTVLNSTERNPAAMPSSDRSLLLDFTKMLSVKEGYKVKFLRRFKINPGATIKYKVNFPTGVIDTDRFDTAAPTSVYSQIGGFLFFRAKGIEEPVVSSSGSVGTFLSMSTAPVAIACCARSEVVVSTKHVRLGSMKKIITWVKEDSAVNDYHVFDPATDKMPIVNEEIDTSYDGGVATGLTGLAMFNS